MENKEPVIIERVFNAPANQVWKAITEKSEMDKWYFNLAEFRPAVGFEFQFEGGNEHRIYLHLCKITEVTAGRKLCYSWQYHGIEGLTYVCFELFPEGSQTRLRLTHSGFETFPKDNPDLDRKNFVEGWTAIIGTSLANYFETTGK